MMFALVQFIDDTYHIYKSGDLSTQCVDGKHLYSLKYDNKKRYEARLVVYDDSAILLNRMKKNLEATVHDKKFDVIKPQETSVEIRNLDANRQPIQLENAAINDINSSETRALSETKSKLSMDLGNGIVTELTSFSDCKVENLNISGGSLTDDAHIATPLELSNNLDSCGGTYVISPTVGSKDDYHQPSDVSLHADDHDSSHVKTPSKNSSASKLDTSNDLHVSLVENGQTVPDDIKLKVEHSSQRSKRYFCCYCKKKQTKFARHLELIHSQEEEVQRFLQLPVNDLERKSIIAKLRKKSIHEFNTNNQYNTGELMVCRRPNEGVKKRAIDFTVCACCKGYYAKSVFRHHFRKCSKRSSKDSRIGMVKGREVAGRVHEKASMSVRKYIIPYMREDDIFYEIRFDELLILFANKECERYGVQQHQYQTIRSHLRYLGRFLVAVKKINSKITTFSSIYQPQFYDDCILAVKQVAAFNDSTNVYGNPSVAISLGVLLKKVAQVYRSVCIKNGRDEELKLVEDFIFLQNEDFDLSVNQIANESLEQQKRQKKDVLPLMDDISKLYDYLTHKRRSAFQNLKEKFSYGAWCALAEATLVSIHLFNKRSPEEIERILLDDFHTCEEIQIDSKNPVFKSLSKEGQNVVNGYVRCTIHDEKSRRVNILLSFEIFQCAKLVETCRSKANVPPTNPYLFGVHNNDESSPKYFRASKLLRQFVEDSGAKSSTLLSGTELRKHVTKKWMHFEFSVNVEQQRCLRDILRVSKILEIAQGTQRNTTEDNGSNYGDHSVMNSVPDEHIDNTPSEPSSSAIEQPSSENARIANNVSTEKEEEQKEEEVPSKRRFSSEIRRRWGQDEKDIVLAEFGEYLKFSKYPSLSQARDLIQKNTCLKYRTPSQIKSFLQYQKKLQSEAINSMYL